MKEDELDPNFTVNLKKGMLDQLISETTELIKLNQKGHSLLQRNSEENKDNYPTNTRLHFLLIRGLLIEMFVTLDKYLQQLILHHQLRILKIEPESLKYFDRAQKGIKEYFENSVLPPELDRLRNRIKHFRILRNQFAHFEYGRFFFRPIMRALNPFSKLCLGLA